MNVNALRRMGYGLSLQVVIATFFFQVLNNCNPRRIIQEVKTIELTGRTVRKRKIGLVSSGIMGTADHWIIRVPMITLERHLIARANSPTRGNTMCCTYAQISLWYVRISDKCSSTTDTIYPIFCIFFIR